MKRIIFAILFLLPLMVNSQNMYNVTGLLDNAPSGTARFVGMGGSMGALGANLSVMGTNPAGTALYRSNDFYISGAIDVVENNSTFKGRNSNVKYDGTGLNNIGFLFACELENSPVKFINFGINYGRKGNLRNKFSMDGNPDGFSQQYVIWDLYDMSDNNLSEITPDSYAGFNYNWLALLATDAAVSDIDGVSNQSSYYSEETGGVNVADFNISVNMGDQVYIGATLGYHSVDYSRYSCYTESFDSDDNYSLTNNYRLSGSGVDFKLGVILRPFKYSPFRVGLSVHTPVLYKLLDSSSATIDSRVKEKEYMYETASDLCYGDNLYSAYSLRTPWRFGAAMSYTFGSHFALNAEYEYSNLAKMSFTQKNDISAAQNEEIVSNLKSQHTLRLGAEYTVKKIALRAGYNYISAPFSKDAFKYMGNATITETATEYMNKYGKNVATLGLGYAGKMFYIDLAYMYQSQKSDFYPYYDMEFINPVATVNTKSHSFIIGAGIRF
ncbi:MAG: conjugal transfer protein TraF [Bacteroidaceae bacterium]|nr:conjugal transfer protein TraF [Bacteroidaceae bacterium]